MDMPDMPRAVQIGGTVLTLAAAGISLAAYAKDRSSQFFAGKSERIPRVKGARAIILLTQYGVVTAVALSLTVDHPALLVMYHSSIGIGAGLLCGAIGLLVFVRAKKALGNNYTPCFNAFMPLGLTTTGIYSRIRHPIYAANLLLVLAGLLMSGSPYVLAILLLLLRLYIKSARQEEEALSAKFPGYRSYLLKTGRFFPTLKSS